MWRVKSLTGGDAYVIRASIHIYDILSIYRTCNSNCCRYCLICDTSCYNKKIRQQKKHISAWPLEKCFIFLNITTNGTPHSVVSIFYIFIINYFIKMSIPHTWFFIRFESLHLNRQTYRCEPFYVFNQLQTHSINYCGFCFRSILLYLLVVQQVLQV